MGKGTKHLTTLTWLLLVGLLPSLTKAVSVTDLHDGLVGAKVKTFAYPNQDDVLIRERYSYDLGELIE